MRAPDSSAAGLRPLPTPRPCHLRPSTTVPHLTLRPMTLSLTVSDVLVARAKTGDLEALEGLYRAFETPVYNLARRILRNAEDAEDVLQETFLEVVKSIGTYRGDGHLWGWVRQIASSKALMKIRRENVRAADEFDE